MKQTEHIVVFLGYDIEKKQEKVICTDPLLLFERIYW